MLKKTVLSAFAGLFLMGFSVSELVAVEKTIFVHGRSDKNHCGTSTTDVNDYWKSDKNLATSYQRIFVGYDGKSDPREWGSCRAQSNLWTVLYNNCRAPNNCKIICHSAGCYAVDYFFSTYPSVTSSSSYNIKINWVMDVAAATGGSELANMAFWEGNGMVYALKTGNARAFNHNVTGGIGMWHLGGYNGWWYTAAFLPGEDDGAVSYHSSCGKNSTGNYNQCLYNGTNWSNHYVWIDSAQSKYSSGKQGYDRDHGQMLGTAREIWNRTHGY